MAINTSLLVTTLSPLFKDSRHENVAPATKLKSHRQKKERLVANDQPSESQ